MNHIRYLAVARVPDKCLIADYAAAETKERPKELFEEKVDKVLLSGGIDSNQRLTIADPNVGNIHYDADPAFLFMVVTSQEYPQRVAFRLLTEARAEFDQQFSEEISHAKHLGLSKTAKPLLKKLAGTYEDLKTVDKITNVALQVEQVKGMMQNNIEAALKNQDNLETLLDTSDTMRNEASSFNKSTTGVKDRMRWKNTKYMLLIAFFLIVLVAVIVVPIVLKNRGTPAAAKT